MVIPGVFYNRQVLVTRWINRRRAKDKNVEQAVSVVQAGIDSVVDSGLKMITFMIADANRRPRSSWEPKGR